MPANIKYNSPEALLHDFRSGDEAALKAIYDLHYHSLFSYAFRITREENVTEDILAESFFKLWQKRQNMESIKGMIAYLYAIIRNQCLVHLQKIAKRDSVYSELQYLDQSGNEEDSEELRTYLLQLIDLEVKQMPGQMQQVFRLAYIEGSLAPAIAEKLALSVHTVQTHKKLAMKRLRQALAKKGFTQWSYLIFFCAVLFSFLLH